MLGNISITGQTSPRTYTDMMNGMYMLSSVAYGGPRDFWTVKGATPTKGDPNVVSAAITRYIERDVAVGSQVFRRVLRVPLIFEVPTGFTATDVDNVMADYNEWVTPAVTNNILLGLS